jgi:hypothetical protein
VAGARLASTSLVLNRKAKTVFHQPVFKTIDPYVNTTHMTQFMTNDPQYINTAALKFTEYQA